MRTRVLALCAVSLAASLPVLGQGTQRPAEDETPVRDIAAGFAHRWNTRDAPGVVALFDAQHGSVRPSAREIVRGSEEIARWFKGRRDADARRLSAEPRDLRFANARLATFDLALEGATADASGTVPGWRLTVFRADAEWRVLRLQRAASYAAGVVRVGDKIKEPRKLTHVSPVYPEDAKQARIQGPVVLECTISPEGRVTTIDVLSGEPLLVPAATDAVKQWVYTPTLLNDVAVPVIMTVTVNFRLQ